MIKCPSEFLIHKAQVDDMFLEEARGSHEQHDSFKLIRINWLFKIVKGGTDAPSVSAQSVEEESTASLGAALLRNLHGGRCRWLGGR